MTTFNIKQQHMNDLNDIFKIVYLYFSNLNDELDSELLNEYIDMVELSIDTFYPHLNYVKNHIKSNIK